MFSRALSVRSNILARSLLTAPKLAVVPSKFRNFNSSAGLKNSAAGTVEKHEEDPGPKAIIEKYGALTFWGMAFSIAVTKEIFVIDAEFLLALEIGAFALTTYVVAGDSVEKLCKETNDAKNQKFLDANDFMLTMLNQYKSVQVTNQSKPEVLEAYLGEFKTAITQHAAYETISPQHKARAQVLATLEQIQAKEEHMAAMQWKETIDKVVANVEGAFKKDDAKLQTEMMNMAIENIGKDPSGDDVDPVKRLFMAQFPKKKK